MTYRYKAALLAVALLGAVATACTERQTPSFGIAERPISKPFLNLPDTADGKMPALLSQTGAFTNVKDLIIAAGAIPYDLVVPFWSDGAAKSRWMAIPNEKIKFTATGNWKFPAGTVFIKTFDLPTDARNPAIKRRLETRLLVLDRDGGVYGLSYKWRADLSDAELLADSLNENITVTGADGKTHTQEWYYPSRQDCLTCHTARAGGVLGPKTRQLNRDFTYPSGTTDNELRTWNHLGLFDAAFKDSDIAHFKKLARLDDENLSVEDRARSYLDANCSHCHQPGGTVANWDARYDTPLDKQGLIDGPVLIGEGIDHPRVISPHDVWRSILYMRVATNGDIRMPPLARQTIDEQGVTLLQKWIDSLPGRAVLAPPSMAPEGGTFDRPVQVILSNPEAGADIRYTLDGSAPGADDMRYDKPIELSDSAVLRTRAFKDGFTRSIATQQVFIINR